MLIERIKEIFTNPIPYIFLVPLLLALLAMICTRIRLFLAKRNAELVTIKVIEIVEKEGKGSKFGYDTILEITTKEGIVFEKIHTTQKLELNKEMNDLYEKGTGKPFLSIEKVYNYVAPYGELLISIFIIVLILLFILFA